MTRAQSSDAGRTLSAATKKSLSEARPDADGRGIRVPVKTARDLATIRKLVAIKLIPR